MPELTTLRRTPITLAAATALAAASCSSEKSDDETTTTAPTSSSTVESTTSEVSTTPSESTEAEPAPTLTDPEPEAAPVVEPEPEVPVEQVPEQAPASASAPAYGVPCSEAQISQPATGADGTPLVCVGMGGTASPSWVYGPEAQGPGTATSGGACAEGEAGGQDEQGRMMMCLNGEWVYGP